MILSIVIFLCNVQGPLYSCLRKSAYGGGEEAKPPLLSVWNNYFVFYVKPEQWIGVQ